MKNKAAFTLIEVLIALLIIAIALAAAIRATNEGIRSTMYVRNAVTAHWVGLNILSEIQTNSGVSLPALSNSVSGQTQMLGQEWQWVARTEPAQFNHIRKITVTVSLKNKRVTSVSGYVQ